MIKYILYAAFTISSFCSQSQTSEVYRSETNSGLCAATIILYSGNDYIYEISCETITNVSFGKWLKKRDTVKLMPVNPKTFSIIKSVEANKIPDDSVWLTILDKDGVNMTHKISVGLEVNGVGSYLFSSDSSGLKKFVYKRSGGKIVFRSLNKLFGQKLELPTDTANNFVVTLNISSDWITSTHSDWNATGKISLIKKDDVLIHQFPQRQVFKKIKAEVHR